MLFNYTVKIMSVAYVHPLINICDISVVMYSNFSANVIALILLCVKTLEKQLCVCNLIKIVGGTHDAVDDMRLG